MNREGPFYFLFLPFVRDSQGRFRNGSSYPNPFLNVHGVAVVGNWKTNFSLSAYADTHTRTHCRTDTHKGTSFSQEEETVRTKYENTLLMRNASYISVSHPVQFLFFKYSGDRRKCYLISGKKKKKFNTLKKKKISNKLTLSQVLMFHVM